MANEMNDLVVVDDNPVLVRVLSEIFKERGYIVRTASDGFAALATIRDRVPDILISDLNMPRMSAILNSYRLCDGDFLRLPSSR